MRMTPIFDTAILTATLYNIVVVAGFQMKMSLWLNRERLELVQSNVHWFLHNRQMWEGVLASPSTVKPILTAYHIAGMGLESQLSN